LGIIVVFSVLLEDKEKVSIEEFSGCEFITGDIAQIQDTKLWKDKPSIEEGSGDGGWDTDIEP
jgi:hypothetical protein